MVLSLRAIPLWTNWLKRKCKVQWWQKRQGKQLLQAGVKHYRLNQRHKALSDFGKALALCREVGDRSGEGTTLNNLGLVYADLGQPQTALSYYEDALALCREVGDRGGEGATLNNLGWAYAEIGEPAQACTHFAAACQIFESIRQEVLSDTARASFFAQSQSTYTAYIHTLMHWHHTEVQGNHAAEAFQVCERGRARALLDLLAESRLELAQSLDPELAQQQQAVLAELASVQSRLVQPGGSDHERQQLLSQRHDLEIRLEQLEARIRAAHPHYANATRPEPLPLHQVQERLLDDHTALLSYTLGNKTSFLWAVTRDAWEVFFLPPAAEIEQQVSAFAAAFTGRQQDHQRAAYDLYHTLVHPAETFVRDKLSQPAEGQARRLIIVPDGVLTVLPFEFLCMTPPEDVSPGTTADDETQPLAPEAAGDPTRQRTTRISVVPRTRRPPQAEDMASSLPVLLHQYAIVYAPSATVLATLRKEDTAAGHNTWDKTFIGFAPVEFRSANPLPATASEVCGIAERCAHDTATVYLRDKATKGAAQSPALQHYRYVHFATHGHADAEKPQFCGILFPDTAGDVLLHTFEIFRLKLTADLVTVSACNSGLGTRVRGEGMMGLVRAFFYAGARSVCVSLWPVADDSTATLMQHFYRHLLAGTHKAEALRRAKLDLLRAGGAWAHAYHWAPFILLGDW